jgi:hypothetical protein
MGLSNSAARLTTSAVAIAPSHHRRLRVRNVNIGARMPQPDRAPAVRRLRVADGVDQVCFNRALKHLCRRPIEWGGDVLTPKLVARALKLLVEQDGPFYLDRWGRSAAGEFLIEHS